MFEGKAIWKEEKLRLLQGTYPVISLSFANIKEKSYENARNKICQLLVNLYSQYEFLLETGVMTERDEVVTTTSNKYADCFGFTEEEVFAGMDECNYTDKENIKKWYDGFTFGNNKDIYNPWSILNYLDKGNITTYWANTSSNSLVGKRLVCRIHTGI